MFSLDTSTIVDFLRKPPQSLINRVANAVRDEQLSISSVVLFELVTGTMKARRARDLERLQEFLKGGVILHEFDDGDAWAAGEVRASLESEGRGIGPFDTLIAGQALARGLTVVTANVKEFSRVPGLKWENWRA